MTNSAVTLLSWLKAKIERQIISLELKGIRRRAITRNILGCADRVVGQYTMVIPQGQCHKQRQFVFQ